MSSNIKVDIRAVRFDHVPDKELLEDYQHGTNIEVLKKMVLEAEKRKIHLYGRNL